MDCRNVVGVDHYTLNEGNTGNHNKTLVIRFNEYFILYFLFNMVSNNFYIPLINLYNLSRTRTQAFLLVDFE